MSVVVGLTKHGVQVFQSLHYSNSHFLSYQSQPLLPTHSPCTSCSPSWWAPAWPCPPGRAPTCTSQTRWRGCPCRQDTTAVAMTIGTSARRTLLLTWLERSFSRTRTLTETTLRDLTRSFRIQSRRTTETMRSATTPRP